MKTASFLSLSLSLSFVLGILTLMKRGSSDFFCRVFLPKSSFVSASRFIKIASLTLFFRLSSTRTLYREKISRHTRHKKRRRNKPPGDDENDENSREIFVPSGDALQLHLLLFLSSLVLFVENAASSRSDEQSGSV